MLRKITLIISCAFAGLAGCSSNGISPPEDLVTAPAEYVSFYSSRFDDTSFQTQVFQFSRDGSGSTVANGGTVNFAAGTITDGLLAGTFSPGSVSSIDLEDGGTFIESNFADNAYLRAFGTRGTSNDSLGIVGQVTFLDDLPTAGDAIYIVFGEFEVFEGADTDYSSKATGRALVNFGNNSVTTEIDNLRGYKNPGEDSEEFIEKIGGLTITDATISGTGFSGGTVKTTGDILALSTSATSDRTVGQFFGPQGEDIGGLVDIEDPEQDLRIFGYYSGRVPLSPSPSP